MRPSADSPGEKPPSTPGPAVEPGPVVELGPAVGPGPAVELGLAADTMRGGVRAEPPVPRLVTAMARGSVSPERVAPVVPHASPMPGQTSAPVSFPVRRARTSDVPHILGLVDPYVRDRILLGKERVDLYGAVPEFRIVETPDGEIVGCGALHVIWEDLGEVRTLAAAPAWRGRGVGHALVKALEQDARALGLTRLFCLTFEVDFFARHGFRDMGDEPVAPELFAELVRSTDEGVAEFLDLARVKPNTLGNTRMSKVLNSAK